MGRPQLEPIAVVTEVKLGAKFFSPLTTEMQQGVRTTLQADSGLQLLIQDPGDQAKETDEVGLARPIGADQHVKSTELDVAIRDGFVAAQHEA